MSGTPIGDRLAPTWRRTLTDDLVELTNTLTDRACDTEARLTALEHQLTDDLTDPGFSLTAAEMHVKLRLGVLSRATAALDARIAALERS